MPPESWLQAARNWGTRVLEIDGEVTHVKRNRAYIAHGPKYCSTDQAMEVQTAQRRDSRRRQQSMLFTATLLILVNWGSWCPAANAT